MTLKTFRKALELCGGHCILGGGEPTLHPQFERFLLEAIVCSDVDDGGMLVVTNGKITRRAMMLAKLAQAGVIYSELSTDEYHDPIDPRVYEAFEGRYRDNSHGGQKQMLAVGRALDLFCLEWGDVDEECCCDEWIVQPDGTIRQCGCPDAPLIGNVDEGIFSKYHEGSGVCHRSDQFREAVEEVHEAA